jgi:hypothetical protein
MAYLQASHCPEDRTSRPHAGLRGSLRVDDALESPPKVLIAAFNWSAKDDIVKT